MRALSPTAESLALIDAGDLASEMEHPYCPAVRVVANWHNGVHDGAFLTCREQPCLAVQKVSE